MYTGFTVSCRSSCAFLSSGCFSVSHFPHAQHFSAHGKQSDRGSRKNYTFLIFSYQLLSGNSVERFLTSPDRNFYPTEPPEAVGARTSKGTSHPMTCGGCYHAQVMAGGESQLSVFIANQGLSDFSEDGKRESPAIARPVTKHICGGVSAYPSVRLPQNPYGICRKVRCSAVAIRFSRNLHRIRS